MWIYFNKNHLDNKRGDLVYLPSIESAQKLVEDKICQEISDPHEFYEHLEQKELTKG